MAATACSPSLVTVTATHTLKCATDACVSSCRAKLGPFDQLVVPSVPTSIVFVYKRHGPTKPISVDRLLQALACLLDYYPHLTARLQIDPDTGTYDLAHVGTGATLFTAQCNQPLDTFSTSPERIFMSALPTSGNALLPPFDGSPEGISRDPLFTIQHTRFTCGGVSLGIRLNHIIADGDGYFQLVRNLAEMYRCLKPTDAIVSSLPKLARPPQITSYMSEFNAVTAQEKEAALAFEPTLLHVTPEVEESTSEEKPSVEADATPTNPLPPPPPTTGRILRFSSSELAALKAYASDPNGDGWISTFDAVSALLYQSIYQARLQYHNGDVSKLSPPDFLTPVNFRRRLSDLSSEYFSNALLCAFTSLSPELLANGQIWQIARALHDMTSNVPDAEHIKNTLRWIKAQPKKQLIGTRFRYGTGSLMVSQWAKFDMYAGAEFDEGERPVLVSPPFTPIILLDGLAYLLPTEAHGQKTGGDKGAIDVNLALLDPVWDFMGRHELLNRFSSTRAQIRPELIAADTST